MKLLRNISRLLPALQLAAGCTVASLALLAGTAGAAWTDPPTRAGRIAEVSGTAWLFDPDTQAWVRVLRNQTVGQGDQLRTDARARVTMRMGSSTVWMDEQSDVEVLQMDDAATVLRLTAGDVALRLRTPEAARETRVQTREGVISPETEGLFRVDQRDRGSRVAVVQGRAQFDSDPGAPVQRARLREGEQAEFWGAESARMERQPISRDRFSAFFLAQDQAESTLAWGEDPYVSPEMTGAEELSQNGTWEVVAEFGNVWIPSRVAAGWEPYRDGRWVWTRQWGWSWVDNAPWGFAPFHYGRWVQYGGRWAWAPGRYEARPTYAPALVALVGGPQVSVGVTIGNTRRLPPTAWVPLLPRQSYVPVVPHSAQYRERFRWSRDAENDARFNGRKNDRNDRNQTPIPRGDAGPQPYRPVPSAAPVTGVPNPNPGNPGNSGNAARPWNRHEVQVPPQVQPQQPVTVEQRQWRAPVPAQYDNRDNRDNRDGRDARGVRESREGRLREPVQPAPQVLPAQLPPQPQPQAQAQPVQNRPQVPLFNREVPLPGARPVPQPAALPQVVAPQVQPAQPVATPQPHPTDDERLNGKRNKRESQDRDFR